MKPFSQEERFTIQEIQDSISFLDDIISDAWERSNREEKEKIIAVQKFLSVFLKDWTTVYDKDVKPCGIKLNVCERKKGRRG